MAVNQRRKNLRSKRVVLFLGITLMVHHAFCSLPSKTWISCSFDKSGLEASSTRKESHEVSTSFACVSLASSVSWAYLSCFWPANKMCTFWDELALSSGKVVQDPTLGATACKTLLRPVAECDLPDGGKAKAGEVVPSSFCVGINDVCWADGFIRGIASTGAVRHSSCSAPFSQQSYGCTLAAPALGGWCKSREYCISKGGDLYVPETTQQWKDLFAYVKNVYHYVGCYKEEDVWHWLASPRDPTGSGDWHPDEPNNTPEEICGHTFKSPAGAGLGDYNCQTDWAAMCEAKIES